MNNRPGIFGFPLVQNVDKNVGIWDQMLALNWINPRQNFISTDMMSGNCDEEGLCFICLLVLLHEQYRCN